MNDSMKKRLEATKERYEQIEKELSDENIDSDLEKLTKLSKEKANLTEAYDLYCRYLKLEQEVKDSYELENDPEMADLAKEQRKADQAEMEKMESEQRKELCFGSEGSRDEQVEIYNLGSGVGTSVLEMVRAFSEASGRALPYKIAERRAGDLPTFYANPAKAERELGWKTERTVADAMNDTLNYLRKSCGVEI